MSKENTEFELSLLLSREQRRINADAILDTLKPEQQDFNVMLVGFADIIQSTFYQHLSASFQQDEAEHDMMEIRINKGVSEVMRVLNTHSHSTPEDMVILSTIMLEATAKALQRQLNNTGNVDVEIKRQEN